MKRRLTNHLATALHARSAAARANYFRGVGRAGEAVVLGAVGLRPCSKPAMNPAPPRFSKGHRNTSITQIAIR
jgi:hypothetical protein